MREQIEREVRELYDAMPHDTSLWHERSIAAFTDLILEHRAQEAEFMHWSGGQIPIGNDRARELRKEKNA